MVEYPKCIDKFKWKDLDKKVVRIVVAELNPECLEFTGQVYAMDLESGKIYLIHEWDCRSENESLSR